MDESGPVNIIHMAVFAGTHKANRDDVIVPSSLAVFPVHQLGFGHEAAAISIAANQWFGILHEKPARKTPHDNPWFARSGVIGRGGW